jgi:hypothetical protein
MLPKQRVFKPFVTAFLAVALAVGAIAVPVTSPAEAATKTPVMQKSKLTPAQIAAWFKSEGGSSGYRASVPVEYLAAYFVFEGDAEGLSGDIAFAQSVVETGWFSFPESGQVTPSHNNFAGIGACDGGTCGVARFRSARIGVRAQIQHLRAYADPTVTHDNLAYPLESPRFDLVNPKGRAPNWEDLGGSDGVNPGVNWASDPDYGSKILRVYGRMLNFAKQNPHLGGTWLFSDVAADSTFERDIIAIAVEGITKGCGSTDKYCPRREVTRAQMASFIVRANGLTPVDGNTFRDVSSSNAHRRDINALAAAGLTRGCNPPANDRFCPDKAVTRAEMASFLVRAKGLSGLDRGSFTDVPSTNPHRRDINRLAATGVTRGCNPPTNDRFCPGSVVTRDQMAAFLNRAFL